MDITYQGQVVSTSALTIKEFFDEKNIKLENIIIEYNNEIYHVNDALEKVLDEGAILNIFRIVAGG